MRVINEEGKIEVGDRFLSPRIIIEILENFFRISVIEQRSNYINVKLIRFVRLYGFPFIGPQASVEIWIDNKNGKLHYKFFWPEFYLLIIPFLLILSGKQHICSLTEIIVISFAFFTFAAVFIFLDTRWVAAKFRKAFK